MQNYHRFPTDIFKKLDLIDNDQKFCEYIAKILVLFENFSSAFGKNFLKKRICFFFDICT